MAAVKVFILLLCISQCVTAASLVEKIREKRSDDPSPLQVVVDNLTHQLASLTAKYDAMQTSFTALQAKLNSQSQMVGFHAWGSVSPIDTVAKGTVVLGHAQTNVGNAYDPRTGLFTAPVAGLYHFHATFMDHDVSDRIDASIYVDNGRVAGTVADSRHGYWDNPGIAAVVHLTPGQRVQLKSDSANVDHFYGGTYTTFSGFLIRAD